MLIKGEEPNAFACPGGLIFVSEGLVKLCESEDELAGVLAHEMAHAVDWSEPGSLNGYYQISSTPEWKRAWRVDLASGALNTYATFEPEEGFAEFARLVWSVPGGKEIAEREFPVAFKVFAGFGLI
jgi:hypothetical protein